MDDNQINATALGVFAYLKEQCNDPLDALSIILCLILLYYEKAKNPTTNFPIEEFAENLGKDMIHLWKTRKIPVQGTDTVQ